MNNLYTNIYLQLLSLQVERYYIVKSGDMLSKIALLYKVNLDDLIKLNNFTKLQANKLRIGQKILLPPANNKIQNNKKINKINKNKKQKNNTNNTNNNEYVHIVEQGDNFYTIAKKYFTTFKIIKKLNPNVNPRKLQIGQKINVPKPKKSSLKLFGPTELIVAKNIAYEFIKKYLGTVKYKNYHVVYNDKLTMNNPNKKFLYDIDTLLNFLQSVAATPNATPTIGFGTTNINFIKANKGKINEASAIEQCKKDIDEIFNYMPQRFGKSHWNVLNRNQRAAIVSFFYQQGKDRNNLYVKNLINAITSDKIDDAWQYINSTDPKLDGRRKALQNLYQTKIN